VENDDERGQSPDRMNRPSNIDQGILGRFDAHGQARTAGLRWTTQMRRMEKGEEEEEKDNERCQDGFRLIQSSIPPDEQSR
jgi:hypothetical protein